MWFRRQGNQATPQSVDSATCKGFARMAVALQSLPRSGPSEVGRAQQEAGRRKQEAGSRRQEAGSRKSSAGSRKQEVGSAQQEAGSRKQKAGRAQQEEAFRTKTGQSWLEHAPSPTPLLNPKAFAISFSSRLTNRPCTTTTTTTLYTLTALRRTLALCRAATAGVGSTAAR